MPEKNEKNEAEKDDITPPKESENEANWAKDQREKGYYYDDDHGYEIYDPEKDTDD